MSYVQGSYQRVTLDLHFAFSQVNHVSNPIANERPNVCPLINDLYKMKEQGTVLVEICLFFKHNKT